MRVAAAFAAVVPVVAAAFAAVVPAVAPAFVAVVLVAVVASETMTWFLP